MNPGDVITANLLNQLESASLRHSAGLRTGTQSIPASSWTVITWQTRTGAWWSGDRIVAPAAGVYLAAGSCRWSSSATATGHRGIAVRVNGSTVAAADVPYGMPGNSCSVAVILQLAANDYIELVARNTTAYAQDVVGASFCLVRLA